MKSKLRMTVALLLAFVFMTYSGYLSAKPDISHSWKGSASSRTWVVFKVDEPDEFHFKVGDAFRIQGVRSNMQLIPLGALRTRWSHIDASGIALSKKGSDKQKLCGKFELNGHPGPPSDNPHFIQIEVNKDDENKLFIDIHDDEAYECGTANHGGRVHAEN